jgi:hypothetical protein
MTKTYITFFLFLTIATCDILSLNHRLTDEICQILINSANGTASRYSNDSPSDKILFETFGNALREYAKLIAPYEFKHTDDVGYYYFEYDKRNDTEVFYKKMGALTAILFLNDDVAGGEVFLPRQKEKYNPKCGDLVMFPSGFTHPYTILQVKIGVLRVVRTYFI